MSNLLQELVKVIGASRANGNGVTPPSTPGTPRKSRSVSPAAAVGAVSQLAFSRSRSSSPMPIGGLSSKRTGKNIIMQVKIWTFCCKAFDSLLNISKIILVSYLYNQILPSLPKLQILLMTYLDYFS